MARFRSDAPLPQIDDAAVPADVLLQPEAAELLAVAVEAAGGAVRTVTPRQVTYHPGRSLTVRYDGSVAWNNGRHTTESFVATAGGRRAKGATLVDDGEHSVAVWRVPHDPHLPGLASALDAAEVRRLLHELGAPVPHARPRLRAYRPGRRAVIEIDAPGARLFLKVVRPPNAESLYRRHVLLADHVPVPRSLGWSPELGIVALQALGGRTLRTVLTGSGGLPNSHALLALLDALPSPAGLEAVRAGWQSTRFASIIAAVRPDLGSRVQALGGVLAEVESALAAEQWLEAVHGDFHEAQLLVDGGRVTGLLDVDTYGQGYRIDDLATMIGHLSMLATGSPHRTAIERYAARLLQSFDALVDPVRLREATAAVVLGLATGPFRVLERGWPERTERCVALSEEWLASAQRVRGRAVHG
jgi:hypothetical protein